MPKTKKPKTHFEQVPLEIVKKIALEEIPDDEVIEGDVIVEPPEKKREVFPVLESAMANAVQHPSHGRRDGAVKAGEHQIRLMDPGEQATHEQVSEEFMKLSDENLL